MMLQLVYLVLVAVYGYRGSDAQNSTTGCDIPPPSPSDVSPGRPAIDFVFGSIRDSSGILLNLDIVDNFYTVDNCMPVVYVRSEALPILPLSLDLSGDIVTCNELDTGSQVTSNKVASATILKFDTFAVPPLADVPQAWYDGSHIVLQVKYSSFPGRDFTSMQCKYTAAVLSLQVDITFDVEARNVGCPVTHWGTTCQNDCPCQVIGRCHTFTGSCICTAGQSDPLCSTVNGSPTEIMSPSTSEQTTSSTPGGTSLSSGGIESTTIVPTVPVERSPGDCYISSPTSDAAIGKAPLVFTFSDIQENMRLFSNAKFSNFLHEVNADCRLNLYTRSPAIPRLATEVSILNNTVTCYGLADGLMDRSKVLARGMILKYLDFSVPRPDVLPEFWYEDGRIVSRITYETFPASTQQSMRCIYTIAIPGINVGIFVDVNTTPSGCPVTHWGSECQSDCPCQNDGRCHTFSGDCLCPSGFSGTICENGAVTTSPSTGGEIGGLDGRNNISDCYPLMKGLTEEPLTVDDFQFTVGPVPDALNLIQNVLVTDQRHKIDNCSLNLFVTTSDLPSLVLRFNLINAVIPCFTLDDNSQPTTTQVAEGTVLKYGPHALPVSDSVPVEWYEGNGLITKIVFRAIPKSTFEEMRCLFTVPFINIPIWIDVATTLTNLPGARAEVPRQGVPVSSTQAPSSLEPQPAPISSTQAPILGNQARVPSTQATTPSSQAPSPSTQASSSSTQPPIAATTQLGIPPEIVVTTATPAVTLRNLLTKPSDLLGSEQRVKFRCLIPTSDPLIVRVGQPAINFTFSSMKDTSGILTDVQLLDHRFDVFNCTVVLFVLSSPLTATSLNLIGESFTCFELSGERLSSKQVAAAKVYSFGDRSLTPKPAMVPADWYEGNGLVLGIKYEYFPGVTTKHMRCVYTVPSTGSEISADVNTTSIGCPASHWGANCDKLCTCTDGGQCYTFVGECHCFNSRFGKYCEQEKRV